MKRIFGRKLLGFLFMLMMVVGLMPMMSLTVKATDSVAKVGETGYTTFPEAVTAWNSAANGSTLTLLQDVTTTGTIRVSGTKTLDLNGYGIKATDPTGEAEVNYSVITVPGGADLTITDSRPNAPHTITLTNYQGTAVTNSAETTNVGNDGSGPVSITGGYITGGISSGSTGAGIDVNGSLTMNGGTIIGNKNPTGEGGGGLMVFDNASVTLGGNTKILYNYSAAWAGGVCIKKNGKLSIKDNVCIQNNKGMYAGIYFFHHENNNEPELTISGSPTISNNEIIQSGYSGGEGIYVGAKVTISIDGELTGTDKSIRLYSAKDETTDSSPLVRFTETGYINKAKFSIENTGKALDINGNTLVLATGYTVTYNNNGGTGTMTDSNSPYVSGSTVTVMANGFTAPADDFIFAGWNTEPDGKAADGTDTTTYASGDTFDIRANTTLYAMWKHTHETTGTPTFYAWTDAAAEKQYNGVTAPEGGWKASNCLPKAPGNYCLTSDVTLSRTWFSRGTVNLCLNGYGIGIKQDESVRVMSVNGEMNLYDCGTAVHSYTVNDAGLATVDGTLIEGHSKFEGGYITGGNNNGSDGGCAYIASDSSMTMNGGTIIGNQATNGGAFFIAQGSFTLNDGNIIGNQATNGGAFYIGVRGSLTLNDGNIIYNTAESGGGINRDSKKLIITGGTVAHNYASDTIKENNAGGISGTGPVDLSGTPIIKDNFIGTVKSNLFVKDKEITIAGKLTENAEIGVTKDNGGVFTNSSNTAYNDPTKFTSDNDSYAVGKNTSGQLFLGSPVTVTFNMNEHGTNTTQTLASGSIVTEPTAPTASGYSFGGWYKEAACTNAWNFASDTVTANTTLYAKWTATSSGGGGTPAAGGGGGGGAPAGGGGGETPTNPTPSLPENPAANVNVTENPSAGKTAAEPPVTETKTNDDGSTTEKTSVTNTDGSTTETEKTTTPDGSTTSKTVVTETDGTVKTQETVENKDGSKEESATIVKENGDFVEKTVVTTPDGKKTEESSSKTTDEKTKAVTETKSTVDTDGSTTDYGKTTQTNGDFEEAYVAKDKDGNVIEAKEASKVTDPATGAITETSMEMNSEGSEESVLKTEKNGDYESSSKKSDAEGNLIEESTGSKKSEANGDYVEKKETKDGNGNVLESFEAVKKTDTATGTVTETEKSVARDGSVKELEIVKGTDNKVVSFSDTETNAEGVKTDSQYSGKKDGTLTLDKMTISQEQKGLIKKLLDKLFNNDVLIIPGSIAGIDQETFIVSEIGKGAFEGQKLGTVTLPDSIVKVDTDAFKDCGMTELNVTGKVTKKLFAKDSLSGCGNKSKGKGLTINVQSKRDQKQMKKLLRRAGVAKAKVKVHK